MTSFFATASVSACPAHRVRLVPVALQSLYLSAGLSKGASLGRVEHSAQGVDAPGAWGLPVRQFGFSSVVPGFFVAGVCLGTLTRLLSIDACKLTVSAALNALTNAANFGPLLRPLKRCGHVVAQGFNTLALMPLLNNAHSSMNSKSVFAHFGLNFSAKPFNERERVGVFEHDASFRRCESEAKSCGDLAFSVNSGAAVAAFEHPDISFQVKVAASLIEVDTSLAAVVSAPVLAISAGKQGLAERISRVLHALPLSICSLGSSGNAKSLAALASVLRNVVGDKLFLAHVCLPFAEQHRAVHEHKCITDNDAVQALFCNTAKKDDGRLGAC